MRIVLSKVSQASVRVSQELISELPRPGLLALLGVGHDDTKQAAESLARKVWELRILDDERSAKDLQAPIMVVSQFTLFAATRKGRRPSWQAAAPREHSEPLVEYFCDQLEQLGAEVYRGKFGADMEVASVNDGPVTIWIDTDDWA